MAAMAKAQHAEGVFNHFFLPGAPDGPILCLWECQDLAMGKKAMQKFIDGPSSPASTLVNEVYPVYGSSFPATPASAWPQMPKAAAASSGSFFWVHHTFNKGQSASFFEGLADMDAAAFTAAMKAKGFYNHCFLPTGMGDADPVFCIWESKKPMSAEDFQVFIDERAPGIFTNAVYKVMDGGAVPSAAFPASFLDETMAKIEEALKDGGLKIEGALKEIEATFKKMQK